MVGRWVFIVGIVVGHGMKRRIISEWHTWSGMSVQRLHESVLSVWHPMMATASHIGQMEA
jgi:hypothetical protein